MSMIEIKGKYSDAKIFTNNIDNESLKQIMNILDSEVSKGSVVRIMPDVHAGVDGPIGLTMTINDTVSPSLVGPDIGCGVSLWFLKIPNANKTNIVNQLDEVIHKHVPAGRNLRVIDFTDVNSIIDRKTTQKLYDIISQLKCVGNEKLQFSNVYNKSLLALGTLGGGNHFIEAYSPSSFNDKKQGIYLSIHSGSRTLGGVVYNYYKKKSVNPSTYNFLKEREALISKLKEEKRFNEIKTKLDEHRAEFEKNHSLDNNLTFLIGKDADNYIHDVGLVTEYAFMNRYEIVKTIAKNLGLNDWDIELVSDNPHNYIDTTTRILRKGSQSANGLVLIPINMRDGMIIGQHRDFDTLVDWNFSAPHGAGRVLSRTAAKKTLSLDDFKNEMKGIYSTTISEETLDEAPGAYKSLDDIKKDIEDHIWISAILKPIYNFKGGSEKYSYENKSKDERDEN